MYNSIVYILQPFCFSHIFIILQYINLRCNAISCLLLHTGRVHLKGILPEDDTHIVCLIYGNVYSAGYVARVTHQPNVYKNWSEKILPGGTITKKNN